MSFAVYDKDMGIKSITLIRTFFYEKLMDEDERGVKVSLEGNYCEREYFNILKNITVNDKEVEIKATFREYKLDITKISKSDIKEMITLLKNKTMTTGFQYNQPNKKLKRDFENTHFFA